MRSSSRKFFAIQGERQLQLIENVMPAFAQVGPTSLGVLPHIIRQLKFTNMLDLGCGNGQLLLELGRREGDFVGWGVDANPAMLKEAQVRVRTARLQNRIRLIAGSRGPTKLCKIG